MSVINKANGNFEDVVAQLVRGGLTKKQEEELYQDENLDLLFSALTSLKKSVESQLSAHKSRLDKKRYELHQQGDDGTEWMEYKAEIADWRAKVTKFLSVIEEHICSVRYLIKKRNKASEFGKFYDDVMADEASAEQ